MEMSVSSIEMCQTNTSLQRGFVDNLSAITRQLMKSFPSDISLLDGSEKAGCRFHIFYLIMAPPTQRVSLNILLFVTLSLPSHSNSTRLHPRDQEITDIF